MITTFRLDAYNEPSRPCVWCGLPCWSSWQECNAHARGNPWHSVSWWRMVARLRMHDRWRVQYLRRHPEHDCMALRATTRASRLRWHWGGRHGIGYEPDFGRLWNLYPVKNPHAPKYECRGGVWYRQGAAQ